MTTTFEFRLDDRELQELLRKLNNFNAEPLMDILGQLLETQTQGRIAYQKTSPDGTAWVEWSERYAKTREGNHSLLVDSSRLLQSIYASHTSTTATVGTPMVYARAHQMGNPNKNIPARPFLGLSSENKDEIHDATIEYLHNLLNT